MDTAWKEEYYEADILAWLRSVGISADKIISEGFYNARKWFYQPRKSNFIPLGMSDIIGVMPNGRYVAIEVKTPTDLSFFDRPLDELIARENEAIAKFGRREIKQEGIKKYTHAVEQRRYLDSKIENGGIGFFASTVEDCIKRFAEFGIVIE